MPRSPMNRDRLTALDLEYTHFNARKSVGDPRESRFSTRRVGNLLVTRDPHRAGAYYNRVLGLTPTTAPSPDEALDEALTALPPGSAHRVDVDRTHAPFLADPLTSHGFRPTHHLVWLVATPRARAPAFPVRRLGPEDRDAVRRLLELQGPPIDDAVWASRSRHHATDTFRFFAIDSPRGGIAALATTFLGERGAVLGNAYTRAGARGRGYQRALLEARLTDAAGLGLDRVVTDVEADTASHRNCLRAGFQPLLEQILWESRPEPEDGSAGPSSPGSS